MNIIKSHIENNLFSNIYLIFGKETFFKNIIQDTLTNSIIPDSLQMMNVSIFDDKSFTSDNIDDIFSICDTMPFMSETRLVILKDTDLFKDTKKIPRDLLTDYLLQLPSSTKLFIIETTVNKTTKLFKYINKTGSVHCVDDISENNIITYIQDFCKKNNASISHTTTIYLIKYVSNDMQNIINELDKLISYFNNFNNSSILEITTNHINQLCTKSIDAKIFDLIDGIAYKNINIVLEIYQNLLHDKVTPYQILNLISRQFRIIFKVKNINNNFYNNSFEIAKKLSLNNYIVKNAISQSNNFTNKQLVNALNDCLETDVNIKTGVLPPEIAVELLIIKYTSY